MRPRPERLLWAWLAAAVVLVAVGCGGDGSAGDEPAVAGTITVFAAASLSEAFAEIAKEFKRANPGTEVRVNTGSSAALATQINEGAPADVFASANHAQMTVVVDRGGAAGPRAFVTNLLVLVVPEKGEQVRSLGDLARPGVRLVIGGKDVPAGQYARESLKQAGTSGSLGAGFERAALANVRSEEPTVRAVLAKVELGEADAGIVYATDVTAARGVRAIEIPAAFNVVAEYPIAALRSSHNPATAQAFVDFVLGPHGQSVLKRYGFGPPP